MIAKILIANRSEAAVRIIRACREMGIKTVAVFSEAERDSLHVALADESVCVGGAYSGDSYLNMERIVSAAIATGAVGIHPGCGFLSENADFARLCEAQDLLFIGPDSECIRSLGEKSRAREIAASAGVPTVPGTGVIKSEEEALKFATEIGYPVLVKASLGGGGKGIRRANDAESLRGAFSAASGEAKKAFGCADVYIEKYLTHIRHIEVQLLADNYGKIITLGERDCSLQKNNQKVIEETPCPAISDRLRSSLKDAAIAVAREAGYKNAGTVEFLVDEKENFYFIEMNTRLQVEHGVTEEISGIDIVKWQIRIAAQIPLPDEFEHVALQGASIECRINAGESGKIDFLHAPSGVRIHFDSALFSGSTVLPYYDSMLGKLVVWAPNRAEAIRRMNSALCETAITGIATNIDELLHVISSREFVDGNYDTAFYSEYIKGIK
ncbi:MAG: biotin carboxylase N-terminal domain-containing protein [Oscillospiraceae bacterium]|nr:biotin carboxylase N-terminal domain-containing protein [Oscillospiraceae bacterium]